MSDEINANGTASDPVSWISIAVSKLSELVEKIIPPPEIRLARFKEKDDIRYATLKVRMQEKAERRIRHMNGKHPTIAQVDDQIEYLYPKMNYTEQSDMKCIVRSKFGITL